MKKIVCIAAMLASFAASSVSAQMQASPHIKLIAPCFETPEPVELYLDSQTDQQILFTANALSTVATSPRDDTTVPSVLVVYVGPQSSDFTVVMLFENGATCLVANGVDFIPYTAPRAIP